MTIDISGHNFEGPFSASSDLSDTGGVYVILRGDSRKVLDVGESETVRSRVENHERRSCWERYSVYSPVEYAVLYESGLSERQAIEQTIRDGENPPCGEG